jgi:hypothetical protein
MSKKTDLTAIDAIKAEFLKAIDQDGTTLDEVVQFGSQLQDQGMDPAAAAHTLTGWAVEAGAFDPDLADEAEAQAKQVLESA